MENNEKIVICDARQWTLAWTPVEKLDWSQSQMTSAPPVKSYKFFNSA